MMILLDTQMLLWALTNSPSLPENAKSIILNPENEIYYSIVSLWEIEIKHLINPKNLPFSAQQVASCCMDAEFHEISLQRSSIYQLSALTRPENAPRHKDPFDRILICQAISSDMIFLTHDSLLSDYQVSNIRFE